MSLEEVILVRVLVLAPMKESLGAPEMKTVTSAVAIGSF